LKIYPKLRSLKEKTLGVIGVGNIGSALVERGQVMGMSIVGFDVKPISSELMYKTGIKQLDLEELLKVADVISLNCNLTGQCEVLIRERTVQLVKSQIDDLAIFGGQPLFKEKQHVGRPNLGDPAGICYAARTQLLDRINDMLDRDWLTNRGPFVQEFERRIADYLGVKHCISVCNGTIALELAIRALGLTGEVIVPSFTFIATAHALQWQEITPVFCDIDPITHTIDPNKIESMITPRTSGIIGVHVWGQPCNVEKLTAIAQKHNLKLMFDAAHAMGCSYQGQMIGNFGSAEVLSFHATKFLNSFEGGAIVTNDDLLAKKIILMEN
jgi:hypothetical protein